LISKDPIKGKYTQKDAILQENKHESEDPNQFKFHTFKGDSYEDDNYGQEEKSTRKYTHTKRVEQDKVSL